jgi:hypothetical protein
MCVANCLNSIPATCNVCQSQNSGDVTTCKNVYLPCYVNHNCNPNDNAQGQCGYQDGVCGVNRLGGGSAPQTAAINTYACAMCKCP